MLKLRSSQHLLVVLTGLWVVLFIYHEHIVPRMTAARCRWTDIHVGQAKTTRSGLDEPLRQTNVLLVADPQLIDNHTYVGRNELLLQLLKHTVDVYLKQNYRALVNQLRPDYIFFLGDYLDNGRLLLDEYYDHEYARFEAIFNRWPQYRRGATWFTDVPGNHDVGFGDGVTAEAEARFAAHFGAPNAVHLVDGVQFIALDTPAFLSSDVAVRRALHDLVGQLMNMAPHYPRVLLSHVPLYRDIEAHPCGPLRENPRFDQGRGYQYQLALDPLVLAQLLSKLKPTLVFSGDDHDYCDITHPTLAREITVKSISMAMGIRFPAVQLLSFAARPNAALRYDTHMCYLPAPYRDVVAYVVMAVALGVALLAWSISRRSTRYSYLLPHDGETTAVLMDTAPGAMSQKVSAFLHSQDDLSLVPVLLPNYTFTEGHGGHVAVRVWRVVAQFWRRWNLASFVRDAALLGVVVVCIYNVVVWTV